ncbi:transforming growth factor-beta-induced protein ig-h3 [Patella vulgata]|uniref:transforming growth factor-beta-induced protein ig-h3 n=1 Tax=Patella vulgata TaxID=6465 RepID=UPI0021800077|nr:transforming growth factor-beta-induced protein ig-h3 [Patella vulgata]
MKSAILFIFIIYIYQHSIEGSLPAHLRRYARGPNICVIQTVPGTKDRFFSQCINRHLRTICERPTRTEFECCSGFKKVARTQGCTGIKPLVNLVDTVNGLELDGFTNVIGQSGVENQLANQGAYTIFAPSEDAIQQLSDEERQDLLSRSDEGTPNVFYHVAPGRLNFSSFRKNTDYNTLFENNKIRINKYSYGVATANCARITKPNEMATNGIVHIIDKVLDPKDMQKSVAEKIYSDDQFSQFQLAILAAKMVNTLRSANALLTVFAPTNNAFAKLPNDLLDRILTDEETAKKVVDHHVVKGVYCSDSVIIALGLKTLDGSRILFRCKRYGKYIDKAKLVEEDIVGKNGVIHGIDTVLVPDSVKNVAELAKDLELNTLMEMTERAGLTSTLTGDEEFTMFAPSDKALRKLPSGYRAALSSQPLQMAKLLEYHKIKGKIKTDQLIGNKTLDTGTNKAPATISAKLSVNVFRNGRVVVGGATLEKSDNECKNGVIHTIDKVLVPPEASIMDLIIGDRQLSTLRMAIEKAGLSELLTQPYGQYTMIAPTDRAFKTLGRWEKNAFLNLSPERLKKFIERHIINRMVMKCAFDPRSVYGISSRQGDSIEFTQERSGSIYINKKYRVERPDEQMATNGVLYKINSILKCSCQPRIRGRR